MINYLCIEFIIHISIIVSHYVIGLFSSAPVKNGLQTDCSALLNSGMASNNRKLKGKRYLRTNDGPNDNDQQKMQNVLDGHTTATFFDNNINRRIKSRRWIEVSEAVVEDSRVKQHNDDGINVIQHRDKRVRNNRETSNVTMKRTTVTEANSNGNGQGGTGEHLHSFGQASYQSTRQGNFFFFFSKLYLLYLSK
ncbi:uncharacterized protein LOC133724760 isoform X2 [Rosa rugosa]|uniref:uncharacterized protein LOC133724760 isoform X2 n=1 Tax=Rosa rugosa TaxID=74645 RepID=UPI002B4147BD|nr:uncharacterized protein LOC133724760 isoform X2 [Rosa rugosa]